jgi:hypothetical protein
MFGIGAGVFEDYISLEFIIAKFRNKKNPPPLPRGGARGGV